MVNTNELKLGNYLFMPFTSENVKVTGLALKEEKTLVMYIQSIFGTSQYFALPEQYRPIILTEYVLANNTEFKKSAYEQKYFLPLYKMKAELQAEIYRGGLVFSIQSDFSALILNEIKYLHQLQNLVFSLNNAEMVVSF